MAIFVCYFIQMFLQDPQYIFEWKYIVKNRKNVVFDSPFIGHNLLVEDLLPLPGDPLLEPCVQHHVHHAAQRLLGLVLQQLLLTSNTNIFPQYLCQIKCDDAHPGDDPDGGPDLGVPGEVVLVLLPLLHLGLLQAGLPLPGQAHPLHAQYVIR